MEGMPLYQETLRFLFTARLKLNGARIEEQEALSLLSDEILVLNENKKQQTIGETSYGAVAMGGDL